METQNRDKRSGDRANKPRTKGLEVSEAAGAYLAEMLDESTAGDVIRFVFGFEGLEPQPSAVLPEDTCFEHEGRPVLVLDPTMAKMLDGKTLDVEETDDGWQLRLY